MERLGTSGGPKERLGTSGGSKKRLGTSGGPKERLEAVRNVLGAYTFRLVKNGLARNTLYT